MYKLTQKRLETLKWKKLAREFLKLNYLSYDTLFGKIGAVEIKIFPKLGNLVFLKKLQKMSESTNIPIPCTPNNDAICAKTN